MRIVHIETYFQPELGYQTYYLAKKHVERGHEVYVITSDRYAPIPDYSGAVSNVLGQRRLSSGIFLERGLKVIRLPVFFEISSVGQLWLLGLRQTLAKLNPDIICVHGLDIEALRICLSRGALPKAKIIGDCHMVFQASRGGWVKVYYWLYRILFSKILVKFMNVFVAVSSRTKVFMITILGIPPERIVEIPLGCDANLFKRAENLRRALRQEYGIKNDDVVFIYAGKIIPEKAPHLLVDAALQLCKKRNNIKIMFVGSGAPDYLSFIKRKVLNSGLERNFIFVPLVPNSELFKFYSVADVGVWPAQCSMTMIEAMSCSLPVIISDGSEVLERVNSGNGLLYKHGDSKDLEDKMVMLLDNERRNAMAKNARKFAEKWDWGIISERFLHIA